MVRRLAKLVLISPLFTFCQFGGGGHSSPSPPKVVDERLASEREWLKNIGQRRKEKNAELTELRQGSTFVRRSDGKGYTKVLSEAQKRQGEWLANIGQRRKEAMIRRGTILTGGGSDASTTTPTGRTLLGGRGRGR